ncbi:rod shape-determining protein RodA [Glacieibacterium megasporae]|uniref:rod shape-determining protein RodA n=1 Tax=Glacieibacterium megasporae TaxID=2835787 RepID=UPI001C1E4E4A|nr:rod shape-determining protein RodA [Polymorphobacter megasporae]UAJ09122.1 rod shape-determining protein RodA [Polymorphobacter megasporae]
MLNGFWSARLRELPWAVIAAIVTVGGFGLVVLYSAAGGSFQPWALKQGIRFGVLLVAMLGLSRVPVEMWLKWAYPLYGAVLLGLIGVEALGAIGGGSRRWLDLGIIQLQPSEFMKLAIILALARYYHYVPRQYAGKLITLGPPLVLIAMPAALVMLQPDLGTALAITFGGVVMMFLAGVSMWLFLGAGAAAGAALPVVWSMMHDYQRKRVLIFLDPASDPLGAGYHITQSKIAIGSGGLFGKGFLHGTQSHLDYLPELHTDFIFATMAEEWGLAGGLFILALFSIILVWAVRVALSARAPFARLAAMGLGVTLFFYLAINMMMVTGLAPVVGIPLPLVSYGGSAMMTVLILLGIVIGIARGKGEALGR